MGVEKCLWSFVQRTQHAPGTKGVYMGMLLGRQIDWIHGIVVMGGANLLIYVCGRAIINNSRHAGRCRGLCMVHAAGASERLSLKR